MGKGFEFKVYTGNDPEYQERLRNPKREPHRCDDRIEDFCRVLLHSNHWESLDNLKAAWRVTWACLNSDEGEEPQDPYILLTPSDPLYKDRTPKPSEQQEQQQRKSWWRR